jgi:NTE family protein
MRWRWPSVGSRLRLEADMKTLIAVLLGMAVSGCVIDEAIVVPNLEPRFLPSPRPSPKGEGEQQRAPKGEGGGRPIVALVLGGGGLRGYAHIGVLRALEEAGIKPDLIVGTSAGALVGAAYASGMTADEIQSAAMTVKVSSLVDWTWSTSGLMRGRNLASWIGGLTMERPIETFPIRFAAVATDLETGQAVLLDRGLAGRAIQASAAVPGTTVPIAYAGGHLVDGGIASLVPVRAARAMGADVVIAVDIYCRGPRTRGLGALTVLGRVAQMQNCMAAAPEMAEADILIAPPVGVPGMSARNEQGRAILAGYEAARATLGGLLPEGHERE